MQLKTKFIESMLKKAFILLPLLFFTFCDTQEELVFDSSKDLLTKESKVVELLTEMAITNIESRGIQKDYTETPECTGFNYPVTFYAFFGDNPTPQEIVVNSDEELLEFFNTTLTSENPYYVLFPVKLIDKNGEITVVYDLEELEGIIQTALDACQGDNDDDDDDNNDDNDYKFCDKNQKKVYICHKGKTICVSVNAIWGHLEHHKEDFLGECE